MHPGYVFKGKTYKTANGLCGAILKDSGCHEMSCVVNHQIHAYADDRKTVVATYNVTPPKFGEKQQVTLAPLTTKEF
jgi:hypothetical protein